MDPEELLERLREVRAWRRITPSGVPGLEELGEAGSAILNLQKDAIETLNQIREGIQEALRILQSARGEAETRAATATALARRLVNLAVSGIQSVLNSLLDDTGAYVLLVPLPKKGLVSIVADADTPDQPGSNYVQFPDRAMLSVLNSTSAARLRASPSFSSIFDAPTYSLGGNRYLVNTIAGSIYDAGDLNRPKFTGESYWVYSLLVAGATDVTSLLGTVNSLDRLFSIPRSANGVPASRNIGDFVATNVRASPSGRNRVVVVEWDWVPPSSNLTGYDGATITARKYAIVRSTSLEARSVTSILDLFPNPDIAEGQQGNYGAKVLKVADYNGVVRRYVDSEALIAGRTYYYHVAINTTIVGSPLSADSGVDRPRSTVGTETPVRVELPFNLMSPAAVWRQPAAGETSSNPGLSVAPDWTRTPSVARILPGVDRVVDIVTEEVRKAQDAYSLASNSADQYATVISGIVDEYVARAEALSSAIERYTNVLSSFDAGIYGTIRYGQGSAENFIADVVGAIDDVADPNRPPFDVGDEYVVAALTVVVSPDATVVQSALQFLQVLLGIADNEALAGINSITTELAAVEQGLLDQIRGGGAPPADAPVAFSEDMTPRPLGQPDASCR